MMPMLHAYETTHLCEHCTHISGHQAKSHAVMQSSKAGRELVSDFPHPQTIVTATLFPLLPSQGSHLHCLDVQNHFTPFHAERCGFCQVTTNLCKRLLMRQVRRDASSSKAKNHRFTDGVLDLFEMSVFSCMSSLFTQHA